MALAANPAYRIDWWSPLRSSPGEWAGRWDLASTASEAKTSALAALRQEPAKGLVLVTLSSAGCETRKVAVNADAVARWVPSEASLPLSTEDPAQLPPLGCEDLEHSVLVGCRRSLGAASKAEVLDPAVVTAIIEIVHQAFAGTGPAAEAAAVIRREASPGGLE